MSMSTTRPGRSRAPSSGNSAFGVATQLADPMATSSASSSQMAGQQMSRADQIVHRFYLKTVSVLVESRVTHLGAGAGGKGERKKDRWFNLAIPGTDVHKADLNIYSRISSYPSPVEGQTLHANASTIPPLLIAFILDTCDIPSGQTLMWNKNGGRVVLDPTLVRPASNQRRPGIVLERWEFRATNPASSIQGSEMAGTTAYRMGIIHFRALYAFIRLLPAYRLFRRLRRSNTGLRLGIKLWGPEGTPNSPEGLAEAWDIIERDLVGLETPLERMIPGAEHDPSASSLCERHSFPSLDLFGVSYDLGVVYRPAVDFHVEDMESVLSERFVDMDEEWFTPTVARHRLENEARAIASSPSSRSVSRATTNLSSPIPDRGFGSQMPGSLIASRQVVGRSASGASGASGVTPSSLGPAKWGALAEGLPFAAANYRVDTPSSPGPSVPPAYRRLSAHSLQPFKSISASPSTSVLRSAGQNLPIAQRPILPGSSHQSSVGRTSSFLSQSGRSFSHARMVNMPGSSASPPVTGALSQLPLGVSPPAPSPLSPSSLSFSKQLLPRSISGRPPLHLTPSLSSPFMPSSLDHDSPISQSSPSTQPMIKRYTPSLTQRRALPGSAGSVSEAASIPSSGGYGVLRRESGLRHSIEDPLLKAPDNDEIHAFLRALDSWTPPQAPSHATGQATSHQQSGTSSISGPSVPPSPSPLHSSMSGSPATAGAGTTRAPLTRAHVDDMLKRMAGSFSIGRAEIVPSSSQSSRPGSTPSDVSAPGPYGLLSASRPASGIGGQRPPSSNLRHTSSGSSLPRTAPLPPPPQPKIPAGPIPTARSLPGNPAPLSPRDSSLPFPTPPVSNVLSPQTTGGTVAERTRRGPVLIRGGFGAPSVSSKASTSSSSPSHSPIRDIVRPYRSGLHVERERQDEDAASSSPSPWPRRSGSSAFAGVGLPSGYNNRRIGGRTAPSSLGAEAETEAEDIAEDEVGRRGRSDGRNVGEDLSPREDEVDGLMARLALAQND